MQEAAGNSVIEKMLEADKNACRALDEAKEKGNKMVLQAREDAHTSIEKTKENLQKNRGSLEKRLLSEGEKEVAQIVTEKENHLQEMKKQATRQREQVLQELRKILFGNL